MAIGVFQKFVDLYIKADPFTLLAYFKNADYVITDTFHGTVFSIKYQIPFVSIVRDSNQQKLSDLLDKFDLGHRRLRKAEEIEKVMDAEFNKDQISEYIMKYRASAMNYLEKNIGVNR